MQAAVKQHHDRRKAASRRAWPRWLWVAAPAIVVASAAIAWWLTRRGPEPSPPEQPRAVEPATLTRFVERAGHMLSARPGPDGMYVGAALGEGIGVDGLAAARVYKRRFDGALVEVPNTAGALLVAGDAKQLVVVRDAVPDGNLLRGTVDVIDAAGASRNIAGDRTDITDAELLPDGGLAVVRMRDGRAQIEAPLGTIAYRATGPVWSLRASARGTLAFVESTGTGQRVATVERGQPARVVIDDGGWSDIASAAWDGERLLVSATRAPVEHALWAVEANRPRALWTSPYPFSIEAITSDRGVVIVEVDAAAHVWAHRDGSRDRELGMSDRSSLVDLSLDGRWVSVMDGGAAGPPSIVARLLDGGAPVAVGSGWGGLIAPDARWVAVRTHDKPWHIVVSPFQTSSWDRDTARDLPQGDIVLFHAGGWLGDDLVYLADGAHGTSVYRQTIDGKPPHRIGPWPHTRTRGPFRPSPDGKYIADTDRDGNPALIEVATLGVTSLGRTGVVAGWTDDASAVFVADLARWPVAVTRVPVANPQAATPAFTIEAPGGGVLAPTVVRVAGDGRTYAYAAATLRSTLYRVEGVLRDDQAP